MGMKLREISAWLFLPDFRITLRPSPHSPAATKSSLRQWMPETGAMMIGTAAVFIIRTLASIRHWNLPVYVLEQDFEAKE